VAEFIETTKIFYGDKCYSFKHKSALYLYKFYDLLQIINSSNLTFSLVLLVDINFVCFGLN